MPDAPLAPPPAPVDSDAALERFLGGVAARGLSLYPEQEEAILELYSGRNVILATPTGSGKSLVAAAFQFRALCAGRRSVYTCPIKALVNEKFLSLARDFGPAHVGMMTGDATVNPGAPVLCCTAEVLANQALARGHATDISAVVMDEFHYYSDNARGSAWQIPLLTLPQARFLLMSATLGDTTFFERELERLTGTPAVTVRSDRRPVPLQFEYSETPLAERVDQLLRERRTPAYLVHFTQRETAETAQALMSLAVTTRDERAAIDAALEGARFNSPHGRDVHRWLRHGIAVHHAGLLPKYRILVEQLAQRGLLKLICGTDTLGVGINVPIRSVVFTQLWKYDGEKAAILAVRDFRQIAGRAGRRGFDDIGYVIAQAPAHVIENRRAEEKAAGDPRKLRKLVRTRPPEGFVQWDARTFERLQSAPPEALLSRFSLSPASVLLVLGRDGDGCRDLRRLIDTCHEAPARKPALRRRAWQLFRALLQRGILVAGARGAPRKLRVAIDLPDDFSIHHALSLFLLDVLPSLDRASPDYALDVLTLCESVLEDPDPILRAQVARARAARLEELRAAGVPFEQRQEQLEAIEHPKPLREFLYDSFNAWASAHPWIEGENIRPKSIAREMVERWMSFADYIRAYGLERGEGLLLRHLSQVWKVLAQTIPPGAKDEALLEIEDHLRELVRGTDSSLLEEWERLGHGPDTAATPETERRPGTHPARAPADVTHDRAAFRRLIRVAVLQFLQEAAARDWEDAAARVALDPLPDPAPGARPNPAPHRRIEDAFRLHHDARGRFRLDPAGRAQANTHLAEDSNPEEWTVAQVLVDEAGENDWEARFRIPLAASRAAGRPVLVFEGVTPIGGTASAPPPP